MRRASFIVSLLFIAACADKPVRPLDAAVEADSSTGPSDASLSLDSEVAADASTALDAAIDAGTSLEDSGFVVPDGGLSVADLGFVRVDGGFTRVDASLAFLDAEVVEPTADLSAPPVCLHDGTRSEGWYSSVNDVLICWTNCQPEGSRAPLAEARNCDLRAEGWYAPVGAADCLGTTGGQIARYSLACE